MRKRGMKQVGLILVCASALLLAGCGGSSGNSDYAAETAAMTKGAAMDDAYFYDYEEAAEEYEIPEENGTGSAADEVQDTSRKLIRNVDMDVETEEFDALLVNVQNRIKSLSGYLESSNVYNGSYSNSDYNGNLRSANLTARIPADKLDEFLSLVSESANVVRKDENVTDVTLQYVDMQSHKEVLLTEQERLLELLEQAETIDDIITLESRLSEVRYQIESMESQLRTFDNQVTYSTVYLYIEEVKTYTPVKELTRLERMTAGFMASLAGVGNGFLDFCVNLVIALPYLVVWAVVIALIVVGICLIVKKTEKRRLKNLAKAQAEAQKRQEAYAAHCRAMEAQNAQREAQKAPGTAQK